MRKFIKFLFVTALILSIALVGLICFLSPIASKAVKVAVPPLLGTEASLGGLTLNPFAGTVCLRDFHLLNPVAKGFSSNDCFSVSKIFVKLDFLSLTSDKIHIKQIEIVDPKIRCEFKGFDSNFAALTANLDSSNKKETADKKQADEEQKSAKRVLIDEVIIDGAKVEMATLLTAGAAVPIPLPKLTVRDIGKESDGASVAQAVSDVLNAVVTGVMKLATGSLKGVSSAADGAKKLGKGAAEGVGDGAKAVGKAIQSLFGE